MAQAHGSSLSASMFGRFARATQPDPPGTTSAPAQASASPPLGQVQVRLEGLPQLCTLLRAHSEQDLQVGVAQAFGFRSTSEFEVLRLSGPDGHPTSQVEVRVLSRALLHEVAHIESLFTEIFDFEDEVVYSQLAKVCGIPLLRLHRAIPPACGEAVASWLATYHEDLKQVTLVRDGMLQDVAASRIWRSLKARIEAVFPKLVSRLPTHLQTLPTTGNTAEERLESISRLFSHILDEVRVLVLPLRSLRTTANGTWDTKRLRSGRKRLLRVSFEGNVEAATEPSVFIASLEGPSSPSSGSSSGAGSVGGGSSRGLRDSELQASCGFTGHDLYYQVARFFGQTHVQVRGRDGTLVSLEKPHESLLGQLSSASDGVCVDLVASQYQPQPGSFDQLYREVLRILGPRHFNLDKSYRLQLPGSEEMLTTTQGNALITTVILIPINYIEGRQMYLFRSPSHRQCKATLRTFDEFKDMLQTLVHVFEQLTNQMSPTQAERLRGACAEGAPGQTPLAPFDGRRVQRLSYAWQHIHGCSQAGRSAMGILGGLQAATPAVPQVGHSFQALWRVPEEMLLDPEVLYAGHDVLSAYREAVGLLSLPGMSFTGAGDFASTSFEDARRIFDTYGVDHLEVREAYDTPVPQSWCLPHWWRGPQWSESMEYKAVGAPDPWSIVVGGLVGVVFGLLEGLYDSSNEQSLYSTTNMRILEKMVRRGLIGLSVSVACHFFHRLLRQCLPGRYASLARKSVPASQAVVFLGTAAWAMTSRQKYVTPGFMRRLWLQDLNLAERQAAGVIMTSGLACSFSVGGYALGAKVIGGSFGGPAGAFAGSLMPIFTSMALAGLDWWHDHKRRRQMKAAALQTLGLPEPASLGVEVFRPMLATRYKLLARYLHPDKNDSSRCDTTKVFSQIRLAKEILEQELKDYHGCPRGRLRRLFDQMCALCGYRRDRYVSEHPSGLIMNILEDGPSKDEDSPSTFGLEPVSEDHETVPSTFSPRLFPGNPQRHLVSRRSRSAEADGWRRHPHRPRSLSDRSVRSGIDSITTVESRSLSDSPASSPRRNDDPPAGSDLETAQGQQLRATRPRTPRTPRGSRSPTRKASSHRSRAGGPDVSGNLGSGDGNAPWVLVAGNTSAAGVEPVAAAGDAATQASEAVPPAEGA